MGNKQASVFVGHWALTLLILGLYNKLVKQLGSNRTEDLMKQRFSVRVGQRLSARSATLGR